MAIEVIRLINDVQILLNDYPQGPGEHDGDRWKFDELLSYANGAARDIVVRSLAVKSSPAGVVRRIIKLGPGAEQNAIATDSSILAIISVLRNIGRTWITGTTYQAGDRVYHLGIRYQAKVSGLSTIVPATDTSVWTTSVTNISREIEEIHDVNLASIIDNWRSHPPAANSEISFWVPDHTSRTLFSVCPPQPQQEDSGSAFQHVELLCVAIPARMEAGGNLALPDIYADPIADYTQYKAFVRDADSEESLARAAGHMQAYTSSPVFSY